MLVLPPLTQILPPVLPEGGGHGPVGGLTTAGLHLRVEHLAGLECFEERQPGGDECRGQQHLLSPIKPVSVKAPE